MPRVSFGFILCQTDFQRTAQLDWDSFRAVSELVERMLSVSLGDLL